MGNGAAELTKPLSIEEANRSYCTHRSTSSKSITFFEKTTTSPVFIEEDDQCVCVCVCRLLQPTAASKINQINPRRHFPIFLLTDFLTPAALGDGVTRPDAGRGTARFSRLPDWARERSLCPSAASFSFSGSQLTGIDSGHNPTLP